MPSQFQTLQRIVVTVTTAGTPVQVSSSSLLVRSFIGQAHFQNTGNIFLGDTALTAAAASAHALPAGANFAIAGDEIAARSVQFDLSEIWVDTDTNGSKFIVTYLAETLHQ